MSVHLKHSGPDNIMILTSEKISGCFIGGKDKLVGIQDIHPISVSSIKCLVNEISLVNGIISSFDMSILYHDICSVVQKLQSIIGAIRLINHMGFIKVFIVFQKTR